MLSVAANADDCVPVSFGIDQIVCVCNGTFCDRLPENLGAPSEGSVNWYVSNIEGQRMSLTTVYFETEEKSSHNITIDIDSSIQYQQIFGFGGAVSDASGINIKSLSPATQQKLLE